MQFKPEFLPEEVCAEELHLASPAREFPPSGSLSSPKVSPSDVCSMRGVSNDHRAAIQVRIEKKMKKGTYIH